MGKDNHGLTPAEWQVMECLWEHAPRTGRETADWLAARVGWNRSTSLTLLRRLEAKGAVVSDGSSGIKTFRPAVDRDDAAVRETEDLLDRVYRGSVSMLVSALTRKQSVSKEELQQLHAMLEELEANAHD